MITGEHSFGLHGARHRLDPLAYLGYLQEPGDRHYLWGSSSSCLNHFVTLCFRFGVFSSWRLRGLSTAVQTLDMCRILLDLPQTGVIVLSWVGRSTNGDADGDLITMLTMILQVWHTLWVDKWVWQYKRLPRATAEELHCAGRFTTFTSGPGENRQGWKHNIDPPSPI